MEQPVAIVAVCRLAIVKRMPATPLTLLVAHLVRGQVKVQLVQRSGKMKVAIIKAHIGSLLYTSMERQQPRQPPLRNVQQQVTSSLSEVETDSQSDVVDRVVGSSPSSSSNESSPETDFIPEPCVETLPTSKYGRKRARVERDNYVSWDKIVFWQNILTSVLNNWN